MIYADEVPPIQTRDANRRLTYLWGLGGVTHDAGRVAAISARFRLSDELRIVTEMLDRLRCRVWSGDEKGLAEMKTLNERAATLRASLARA
jgi:hypothetical protein